MCSDAEVDVPASEAVFDDALISGVVVNAEVGDLAQTKADLHRPVGIQRVLIADLRAKNSVFLPKPHRQPSGQPPPMRLLRMTGD